MLVTCCCYRVPLPDVWLCALWSLGAGAAASCEMCACARWSLGAGVAALALPARVFCSLGSMLASFLSKDNSRLAASRRRKPITQGSPIKDSTHISQITKTNSAPCQKAMPRPYHTQ